MVDFGNYLPTATQAEQCMRHGTIYNANNQNAKNQKQNEECKRALICSECCTMPLKTEPPRNGVCDGVNHAAHGIAGRVRFFFQKERHFVVSTKSRIIPSFSSSLPLAKLTRLCQTT